MNQVQLIELREPARAPREPLVSIPLPFAPDESSEHSPAFVIENLSAAYGAKNALEKINSTLPRHQITALMGPSGCGKSTLVRILNRTFELIPGAQLCSG